jgi:hypothetical protein
MTTQEKITQFENRTEKTHDTRIFKDLQTFGKSFKDTYNKPIYEQDPYNEYQNFLYKRALFGLKMYNQEELNNMHPEKKERINKVHTRAQYVLNLWKQEKIIESTNKILSLFKKTSLAGVIIDLYSKPDPKFTSKINFKDLGISKEMIINKLLEEKILPKEFEKAIK